VLSVVVDALCGHFSPGLGQISADARTGNPILQLQIDDLAKDWVLADATECYGSSSFVRVGTLGSRSR
jgi:hypothetical protein